MEASQDSTQLPSNATQLPSNRVLSLAPALPAEDTVSQQFSDAVDELFTRILKLERTTKELMNQVEVLMAATSPSPPLLDPQYTRRFRRSIYH